MPVFLQGRRAFFIIPAPPTSPLQPLISPPRHRFGPCLPASRLPRCGCRLPLLLSPRLPRRGCRLPLLPSPRLPPLSPLSDTEAPHGPQPLPLGLKCRHGPRMFSCPARSAATARASFAVLPGAPHGPCSFSCSTERRTADPRPCSARGTKKRTEPHRGPSAAKKQPICRGSITAAALQPVRSVHSHETNPLRIVRAGISG